jgi:hypothetical protein
VSSRSSPRNTDTLAEFTQALHFVKSNLYPLPLRQRMQIEAARPMICPTYETNTQLKESQQ